MSEQERYSIKEMIAEFREEVSEKFEDVKSVSALRFNDPNTGVFIRLDKIDTKQAVANGRTAKLEMWQKLIVGGAIVTWGLTMAIGGYFFHLVKNEIIQEAVEKTLGEVHREYNVTIYPSEK